ALLLVNDSTSPLTKSVIVTVAECSVWLSTSVIVTAGDSTAAAAFSVYAAFAATPPSTGASFTGVMVSVVLWRLLSAAPSFTTQVIVRVGSALLKPVGLSLVEEYLTASSAACHCASVAVLPADPSVSTPPVLPVTWMLP